MSSSRLAPPHYSWAGSTSAWSAAGYSGSCAEAVMDPTNFDNAVFEFNSVKVFTPK